MTNNNAIIHFNGPQHRNKLYLVLHKQQQNKTLIWCQMCCCELNTEKALEIHNQSPKHKKKEDTYNEIMELKKNYLISNNLTDCLIKSDQTVSSSNESGATASNEPEKS